MTQSAGAGQKERHSQLPSRGRATQSARPILERRSQLETKRRSDAVSSSYPQGRPDLEKRVKLGGDIRFTYRLFVLS